MSHSSTQNSVSTLLNLSLWGTAMFALLAELLTEPDLARLRCRVWAGIGQEAWENRGGVAITSFDRGVSLSVMHCLSSVFCLELP